jgi:hypothetical protein
VTEILHAGIPPFMEAPCLKITYKQWLGYVFAGSIHVDGGQKAENA